MVAKFSHAVFLSLLMLGSLQAKEVDALEFYDWVEALEGEWSLSPAEAQKDTDSYKHPAVLPITGTSATGIAFKSIGNKSTVQEDLLPNTDKQMVTMYHCKDIACSAIKATHYCVKQNQPEFIANLSKSTKERLILECDMSTELCQSDENHIHTIVHELSKNGNHLKSSYFAWENKALATTHSIYHFDRKQTSK